MRKVKHDRAQRWRISHSISGFIFFFAGFVLIIFSEGQVALVVIGAVMLIMAFFDFRDAQRGWRLKDEPPPNCYRDAKRNDWRGEFARKYIKNWNSGKRSEPTYSFKRND